MLDLNKKNCWLFDDKSRENPINLYNKNYTHRTEQYFDNRVTNARRNIVQKYANLYECFDFGCGTKPFAKDECLYVWDNYVTEFSKFNLKKFQAAKTLLMFDVLEHLLDLENFLLMIPQPQLIVSIPIVPDNIELSIENLKNISWKHYRPKEHFWYFSDNGFKEYTKSCNWTIIYNDIPECPPRSDIRTYVLVRND